MGIPKIDYNIILVPYTVTETNTVGPTTNTAAGFRPNSVLPNTGSTSGSDPNTIYLDPFDGNDANAGTSFALAVKTFANALSKVTATRHTIHIQTTTSTNGTENPLSASISGNTSLGTNLQNIQVEAGQTATLTVTGGGDYYIPGGGNDITINGIKIVSPIAQFVTNVLGDDGPDTFYQWCRVESDATCAVFGTVFNSNNTLFISTATGVACIGNQSSATSPSITADECIFIGNGDNCFETAQNGNTHTLNLTNCVYLNFGTVYQLDTGTISGVTVTNNHSHIIHNCGTLVGTNITQTVQFDYSLINTTTNGQGVTDTGTNTFNKNPLFIDQSQHDYRLAHTGREVIAGEGVFYPRNSPAVGIGSGGVDAGAYATTYTPGADTFDAFEFPGDSAIRALSFNKSRVNYQEFYDIQGGFHCAFDGVRGEVRIQWDPRAFVGETFTAGYLDIVRSSKVLRFWPFGVDGIWGAQKSASSSAGSGELTSISLSTPEEMSPNFYIGWIAKVQWTDSGSKTGYFRITSNTAITMKLEHVRGDDNFDTGTASAWTVNVVYLPVKIAQNQMDMICEYYSDQDTANGIFSPFAPAAEEISEFHTREMILRETTEDV